MEPLMMMRMRGSSLSERDVPSTKKLSCSTRSSGEVTGTKTAGSMSSPSCPGRIIARPRVPKPLPTGMYLYTIRLPLRAVKIMEEAGLFSQIRVEERCQTAHGNCHNDRKDAKSHNHLYDGKTFST